MTTHEQDPREADYNEMTRTIGISAPAIALAAGNGTPSENDCGYLTDADYADIVLAGAAAPPTGPAPTSATRWPELIPLRREMPEPERFPVEALGETLAPMAQILNEIVKAPMALCAQSVLAGAVLAVQGHADLEIDGRKSPLSCFFLTVGMSGERKSAVDRVVLRPHREREEVLQGSYAGTKEQFTQRELIYEQERGEIIKRKPKAGFDRAIELAALGGAPAAPIKPFFLTGDPTYEGLIKILAEGQPTMGLFSDEGAGFTCGYGMNKDNALKTAAGLSGLWDGKNISRIRAGDGAALLCGRRLSFHLMLQPNIARELLSNAGLLEQGLLSRCLLTWPVSTVGTRIYCERNIFETPQWSLYSNRIAAVLNAPLPLAEGSQNELKPRAIGLTPGAKKLFIRFHDWVEEEMRDGGELAEIRGFASKAPEHAARIAGALTMINDLGANSIGEKEMASGTVLASHYINEASRLFAAGACSPEIGLAEQLAEWLRLRGKTKVTLVEIYQAGISALREARKARAIMEILEKHGFVLRTRAPVEYQGRMRKEAWEIRS